MDAKEYRDQYAKKNGFSNWDGIVQFSKSFDLPETTEKHNIAVMEEYAAIKVAEAMDNSIEDMEKERIKSRLSLDP